MLDADSITAGDGERAAPQYARHGAAVVQRDGVVAAVGGGDEAGGRDHRAICSIFAAQMQSFSVTPPASCVDQATEMRL